MSLKESAIRKRLRDFGFDDWDTLPLRSARMHYRESYMAERELDISNKMGDVRGMLAAIAAYIDEARKQGFVKPAKVYKLRVVVDNTSPAPRPVRRG